MPDSHDRQHAPATQRNRAAILDVLLTVLPGAGTVLEVASGTGEHVVHFARAMPELTWQPSDPDAGSRRSIAAWTAAEGLANVAAPLDLDARQPAWPITAAEAAICINMIHISPWEATEGLMRGAGRILRANAPLYLYGPYRRTGYPLEPSNAAFDESLKARDPRWGLRELDEVAACAGENGFACESVIEMPANNLSVIFRRG